jgi:outer membrane protein, multidrug efflux system
VKTQRVAIVCLAALLSGCAAVGPDYQRPALEAPLLWGESKEKAVTAPALEKTTWWQALGDPMLNRLIAQAAKNNLNLEQARARVKQARAALVLAGAPGLPTVNVGGTVTRSAGSENLVSTGSSISTVYQAGFDASWEIDIFGGVRRNVESAQARLDASVEDLHATLLTLLGDVTRNYVNLRANQTQLQITRNNLEIQKETVAVTHKRYQLGLTSSLDVAQAEAQKATTESNIPTLEAASKQSIHHLGILLAQEPNALKTELLTTRPLPKVEGLIATGLPSELLNRRPDLRQAERQLAAASADIGVATAGLYPTFDLTLGLGLQASSASKFLETSSRYWSIVPGVSLPLLDGGKARANIAGKQAIFDESLAKYRAAYYSALEDVENALTAYYAERAKHRILIESVRVNEEAVTLASERYRRGLTTFLDVLTTQAALFSAQSSLSQSNANQLVDLVSLYKALGGGWDLPESETSH